MISSKLKLKDSRNMQRKKRIRSKVTGTTERPRLTVSISNLHVTAQVIDDSKHHTLAYATTVGDKTAKGTLTEQAQAIGKSIAKKCQKAKITEAVFDRNGRMYHGRIKALAEAAREEGLVF
jgi:large subunit ribosomal protein L18